MEGFKDQKARKEKKRNLWSFLFSFCLFLLQIQDSNTTFNYHTTKLNRVVQRTIIGVYFEPEGTFVPNSKRSSQENTITIFACNQFDMEGIERFRKRRKCFNFLRKPCQFVSEMMRPHDSRNSPLLASYVPVRQTTNGTDLFFIFS